FFFVLLLNFFFIWPFKFYITLYRKICKEPICKEMIFKELICKEMIYKELKFYMIT
ncbi:hypothetical protein RYX36_018649, partial [Vicia faba]